MEKSQRIDKAARLIEYLTRLADLRRKSVKDVANYNQVLWLQDIPKHKGCFTQAWGGNKDYDDSVWIEIQSRREPSVPKIPNVCQDWVDQEALYRKTDIPLLRDTIVRQIENENWSEDSDQPRFFSETDILENHPAVSKKWEQYVEQKWILWSEEHDDWESIQKVYTKLFTIYQEQVKLGEEYELIIGMGLLTWQTPQTQPIQRHLLVATASLEFESRLGKFTVRPNADGANLRPELEMLEGYQPPKSEEIAKEGLQAAEDNPWVRSSTDGVLKGLVHSIDSKGEYDERLVAKAPRNSDKPIVEYAPALILRKRSARGLTEILRKLKIQIEAGEDIPVEFKDLAEIKQHDDSPRDGDGERIMTILPDGEIYFPKPSNNEQRQIIEKLNHSDGVLVQGPPGTGKTHTIANLICHLLATGKRILVTAKTPRALRVIEQQLPEQVRPLCVNLLREHFRCMPEIIRFSNDLCYSGEPLIPLRQFGADRLEPLRKVHVQGGYREGKASRVVNRPEAEAIADKIIELCGDSRYAERSMGVVILQGEAQASVIENILLERLGAEEMEKRRLICGNPYSFQGDERDIIFLSMVAAPNERIGPLTRLPDERRFNVAASRAKDQMWLFHSVTQNDLSQSCLRSKLLAFFEEPYIDPIVGVDCEKLERQCFEVNQSVVKAPDPFDSWFEVRVALELARKKYRVIPQFEVAGKYIDLVVDGGGSRLAVECDGDAFHDAEHYEQDMERQKILERCGEVFFRIRECEFYSNKEAVLSRLWRVLEDRGISPIGMDPFEEGPMPIPEIPENEAFDAEEENVATNKPPDDLFSASAVSDDPRDIHEAMQMKYSALRDAIIATLKSRPNQSCVKSSVVKFLLHYFEIKSRGKPREAFAYKTDQVLHKMDKAGVLMIYTATNERVKLASEPYLSMALGKDIL